MIPMDNHGKQYGNPYLAGILLGMTLLLSFLILGAGLGASAGLARIAAFLEGVLFPDHTLSSQYFGAWGKTPLSYYLVYMFCGIFVGGFFSAFSNGRMQLKVEKGKKSSVGRRFLWALVGGILVGFASRLAGGCTSGQALTGGALLLTGSLVFLICIFFGGYGVAYFFRRQWHD